MQLCPGFIKSVLFWLHRDVFVCLLAGRLCSSLLHKLVTSPQLFSHSGFQCSLELLKLHWLSMSLIQSRRYIF